MTDNEIIQALKCLRGDEIPCKDCAYKNDAFACRRMAAIDALDLINRQQAEIERLQKYNTEVAYKHYNDGIKEFADRVKMAFYYEFDELIPSIMADTIDNLVKEIVGDTE